MAELDGIPGGGVKESCFFIPEFPVFIIGVEVIVPGPSEHVRFLIGRRLKSAFTGVLTLSILLSYTVVTTVGETVGDDRRVFFRQPEGELFRIAQGDKPGLLK